MIFKRSRSILKRSKMMNSPILSKSVLKLFSLVSISWTMSLNMKLTPKKTLKIEYITLRRSKNGYMKSYGAISTMNHIWIFTLLKILYILTRWKERKRRRRKRKRSERRQRTQKDKIITKVPKRTKKRKCRSMLILKIQARRKKRKLRKKNQ